MNVVHVIISLDVGGAELMLARLIKAQNFSLNGNSHEIITLKNAGSLGKKLRLAGIPVTSLGMRSPLHAPLAILRLIAALRAKKPAIVQTWMYHADLLGGIAARMAGCRNVIWGIRTTDVRKGKRPVTFLVRWVCARLSYWVPHSIVCVAHKSMEHHSNIGYCRERMLVISNGFDMDYLCSSALKVEALRRGIKLGDNVLLVGMLGRFNPAKDQKNFVKAAGKVAKGNCSVRFLMVGRNCDIHNQLLIEWIESTGFADRFILLGERDDPVTCLGSMDIFVLPSRTEGFPNALAEAMAVGLPCISTDVGDAAFVLGGYGKIVPPENADALADGIISMLSLSVEERLNLGNLARQRIRNQFAIEACSKQFDDLYNFAVKTPR